MYFKNLTLFAFLLFFTASPAHAERIIGILSIPSVFSYSTEVTETPKINVFAEPQVNAAVIAVASPEIVTSTEATDLYLPEIAYEENGFEVLAQGEAGWTRVALRRTSSPEILSGWVLPPADAIYTPLGEYLKTSLLDFTSAWDGKLYMAAGSNQVVPYVAQTPRVIGANVTDFTMHDGQLWVHVKLQNNCRDDEKTYAEGWVQVPDDWRIVFDNYSRGC